MDQQWYLCEIEAYPAHEGKNLKPTDNLSVRHPSLFVNPLSALLQGESIIEDNKQGTGSWYVWLPIIPRVGDTLQFSGWQVQVSKVLLQADWISESGIKPGFTVSARITIRDDVIPTLLNSQFSVEVDSSLFHAWETFARRGNDLQYYAWELRHKLYQLKGERDYIKYKCWHTRIRPVAGDIISVKEKRWRVESVELASANESVDGWLDIQSVN